jgi:hypothetical protein
LHNPQPLIAYSPLAFSREAARATLLQSLEALRLAELADHVCWNALMVLPRALGRTHLRRRASRR